MLLPIQIKNANDFGVLNMDDEQSFLCNLSFFVFFLYGDILALRSFKLISLWGKIAIL